MVDQKRKRFISHHPSSFSITIRPRKQGVWRSRGVQPRARPASDANYTTSVTATGGGRTTDRPRANTIWTIARHLTSTHAHGPLRYADENVRTVVQESVQLYDEIRALTVRGGWGARHVRQCLLTAVTRARACTHTHAHTYTGHDAS